MSPFDVTRGDSPVILGQPHGGTWLPDDLLARLNDTGRALADTDWHIGRLYDGLLFGATVVRSNVHLLTKLGAEVTVAGPRTMMPAGIAALGVRAVHALDEAIEGADVVMMLRIQLERQSRTRFPSVREYFRLFGLTAERLRRAAPDVIVMHPGPMNRGVEIASDVADGPFSVILEQVANGVAVRMAVLYLCSGAHEEAA